jgi:probable phosphoglycerate mutase
MGQTELVIIRHGETEWNIKKLIQGHFDSPLTTKGIEQAHILGKRIAMIRPDHIYSSDLGRAYETTRVITKYYKKPITVEKNLRERNLGIFQGYSWETIKTQFPKEFHEFVKADPDYRIPEGESYSQLIHRVLTVLHQIVSKHSYEKVLIITHGGIISSLFRHILSIPLSAPRRYKLKNTSINRVIVENDEWYIETFGDTSHLEYLPKSDEDDLV